MNRFMIAGWAVVLCACSGETAAPPEQAREATESVERASTTLADIAGVENPNTTAPTAGPSGLTAVSGSRTLDYPDDMQMRMLGYRLRGIEPPFESWAGELYEVRYANEFERPEKLREATQNYRDVYAGTADVGFLRMRTGGELSEYDAARGGFYLSAFAPGMSFSFNAAEPVMLQIDNALSAHLWAMPANEASAIFERNQRSRRVAIDMTLRITGIESRGNHPTIHASVQNYSVHGGARAGQLGAVAMPP